MPQKETLSTRVTRLEEAMIRLTNAQAHLTEVQAQDETEIRAMKAEALEREKRLDERIEKLVSAIGEWIRKSSNGEKEGPEGGKDADGKQ